MNTLVTVPRNGGLAKTNSNVSTPVWTSLFDEIFNREFSPIHDSELRSGNLPKVNIKETADEYVIEMAVPGINKSDVKISIDNRILSISADQSHESESSDDQYTRREFSFETFKRTFKLPNSVNDDNINATYADGILKVELPKKEEAKEKPARSIEIS